MMEPAVYNIRARRIIRERDAAMEAAERAAPQGGESTARQRVADEYAVKIRNLMAARGASK
jgi:hypothetical protein